MTQKQLLKTASFTDIHWGCKNNSEQHLQDCDRYIDWFCENVRKDPTIDSIVFMGDWYENRTALNIMTLSYSHRGAEKLNDLGLPVYFIIGNHDLYHKHTRELYSTITFDTFSNFIIVNEPTVFPELGVGGAMLSPFLFPEEYPGLIKYRDLKTWWGHFEFKDFVVTGYSMKMPTGPDASDFAGPDRIFTGHFHKRQHDRNVYYIGNTFPTNYGDVDDDERGMMIYDHKANKAKFLDWEDCPKYRKVRLSVMLGGNVDIPKGARVKCIIDDSNVTSQEINALRVQTLAKYDLREFVTEEDTQELDEILTSTETEVVINDDGTTTEVKVVQTNISIDELVLQMLENIEGESIDKAALISEYKKL